MDCPESHQIVPNSFKQKFVNQETEFGKFIIKQNIIKEKNIKYIEFQNQNKMFLLKNIILNENYDIENLLNTINDYSIRGNIYESIWDIIFKLNYHEFYNSKQFIHLANKIENNELINPKEINENNIINYLNTENIITGNKAGISDITLQEKTKNLKNNEWACNRKFIDIDTTNYIFMTCKYYTNEKHISEYNIQDIGQVVEYHNKKYNNPIKHKIILLIKNKEEFLIKYNRTNKKELKRDIIEIYDVYDMLKYIKLIRNDKEYILKKINNDFTKNLILTPRFHQLLFVNKTLELIHEKKIIDNKEYYGIKDNNEPIVYGQIARSGKTYTCGLLVSKLYKNGFCEYILKTKKKYATFLVITPAPTETISQFMDDMFNIFDDFKNFEKIKYDGKHRISENQFKHRIIICSKQFLQGSKNKTEDDETEDNTFNDINCIPLQNNIDLLIFDEIHLGGTTEISKNIINTIDPYNKTIKIFLTATYRKVIENFDIDIDNNLLLWNMNNIQDCKFISNKNELNKLYDNYGINMVEKTLDELQQFYKLERFELYKYLEYEYSKFPILKTITSLFDEEKLNTILEYNKNDYGFDINSLFKVNDEKNKFDNDLSVNNLMNYIALTIFPRIENTLIEYEQYIIFNSQLWFLPYFEGSKIQDVSKLTEELLLNNPNYNNYSIYRVKTQDDKNDIKKAELQAMNHPTRNKGLIILVGKKFSVGVSLPCINSVFFLNNDSEIDILYQRMFRSLTESQGKNIGFLVDINPYRSISAYSSYSLTKDQYKNFTKGSISDEYSIIKNLIINKLIYIDEDLIGINIKDKKYNDLYGLLKNMIQEYYKKSKDILKTLKKDIADDFFHSFISNDFKIGLIYNNKQNNNNKIILYDKKFNGNKGRKKFNFENNEQNSINYDKKKNENIFMLKNIADTITDSLILLAILFLDYNISFENIIKSILNEKNDTAYQIIYNKFYSGLKDNKENNFHIIITSIIEVLSINNIFEKYNKKFIEMKNKIKNIDNDNFDDIHAFIQEQLTPKEIEKKLYGEVFTPLSLVQEMLDSIDKYADDNFWKNKDLKILDPAVGIGNFPLIAYKKLDQGLKTIIKDDNERKKHILENMLYMVELNPNNVKLLKKIFNYKNYKLNIIEGDFLSEETQKKMIKKWGIEKYDLVMGNPPYQGQQEAKGKRPSIWPKFIIKSINLLDKNGYLNFVTPSGWRKPQTERTNYNGLFELMCHNNHLIYLEIHDANDGLKLFKAATRYEWYLIQNKKSNNKSIIKDQKNIINKINLKSLYWLPNHSFKEVFEIITDKQENRCELITNQKLKDKCKYNKDKINECKCFTIYDRTAYGSDKNFVKDENNVLNNSNYKKILIHSTPKSGIRYKYTNIFDNDIKNDTPMFGVAKIIFGDSGINNIIMDIDGKYGLTSHAISIAIPISEFNNLKTFLESNEFKNILDACSWSNYQIEWRLFTHFRENFWKDL